LILAILSVGYLEWSSNLIRYHDDVTKSIGIPIFGASRFMHGNHATNELAAHLLLQASADGSLPSILVTSATQHESRGRLSVELGEAIVASGRRVLLVTCDCSEGALSKKSIADLHSGKRPTIGIDRIRTSKQHGFDYLTIEDGQEYLTWVASQSLPQFLTEVKQRYESIVLLGPAVLTNPETILLASKVDFTVLSVVLGQTCLDSLLAARNRLQLPSSKILAVVSKAPKLRLTGKTNYPLNSHDDSLADIRRCVDEEEEVLAQVSDLQMQLAQFDAGSPSLGAPHDPSHPRQTLPNPTN
jgi:Mrp family chromosome partitioning ATPase